MLKRQKHNVKRTYNLKKDEIAERGLQNAEDKAKRTEERARIAAEKLATKAIQEAEKQQRKFNKEAKRETSEQVQHRALKKHQS